MSDMSKIALKYRSPCNACGRELAIGVEAYYSAKLPKGLKVRCIPCYERLGSQIGGAQTSGAQTSGSQTSDKPRTGKRTLKIAGQACGQCRRALIVGEPVWHAQREPFRCLTCGPHPGHETPRKDRPTKAEGLRTDGYHGARPDRTQGEVDLTIDPVIEGAGASEPEAQPAVETKPAIVADSALLTALVKDVADHGARLDTVARKLSELTVTTRIEVKLGDKIVAVEGAHSALPAVLRRINAARRIGRGVNLLLIGPAGSGKTTLASQVATALDTGFSSISLSMGATEAHIYGRPTLVNGSMVYQESEFIGIFERGGVFLFDEIDGADPNVLLCVNSALANGWINNPASGRIHRRHPECYVLAAANTYGTGASPVYVGRNALDAATLDRFALSTLTIEYDRDYELQTATAIIGDRAAARDLCAAIWQIRDACQSNIQSGMRRIVSTRAIIGASELAAAGYTRTEILDALTVGWTGDERRKAGLQ